MKQRIYGFLLLTLLGAATAGCGVFLSSKDRALQKDPNFRSGYDDGCASANAEGARYRGENRRDETLFRSSKPYRNGWQSGFSACRSNYAPDPGMRRGPIQDPGPLR